MATAKILLYTSKKLSNGEHPLMIRVYHKTTKYISLKKSCKPEFWDFLNQEPNSKHPNRKRVTAFVRKQQVKIDDVLMDMENLNIPFTFDEFTRRFFRNENSNRLIDFVQVRINEKYKLKKIRSAEQYETLIAKLNSFAPDVLFSEINYNFLVKFETRLRLNGSNDGGVSFVFRALRANINEAIKRGEANYDVHPFANFKIPTSKAKHEALTISDLQKVFTSQLSERGSFYRDLWVCMFLLRGMEFVDIAYLNWKDVQGNRIIYDRSKTDRRYDMVVPDIVMAIFEKYRGERRKRVFPILRDSNIYASQDGYNEFKIHRDRVGRGLARISKTMGLDVKMGIKNAKHTFAELMDGYTADSKMLSDMLGHSDPKTSLRYTGRRKESKMAETIEGFMRELGIG